MTSCHDCQSQAESQSALHDRRLVTAKLPAWVAVPLVEALESTSARTILMHRPHISLILDQFCTPYPGPAMDYTCRRGRREQGCVRWSLLLGH